MRRSPIVLILLALASVTGGVLAVNQPATGIRYADIPDGAYSVVADIRAKPGKENELRAATLGLVAQVRSEPNNLVYFLHEDREAPGHFVFYEIFKTEDDFTAHNTTPLTAGQRRPQRRPRPHRRLRLRLRPASLLGPPLTRRLPAERRAPPHQWGGIWTTVVTGR